MSGVSVGERTGRDGTRAERTSVVIVGAGPAGLTVANLLSAEGVACVLLESESREFIEQRPRAGFLEEWVVRALERRGLAGPGLLKAEAHRDCEFRLDGEQHVFRYGALSGYGHFVYPQQLLVTDLLRAYADEAGGDVRFGAGDVTVQGIDTDRPAVSWTDTGTGERHTVACDFVAGCDGARGVTRAAIPESRLRVSRHDLGIGWLALLAQAPPSAQRVVFGLHPRGFAAHMARGPEVIRYYLECPPGDSPDNWPHERVWSELRARLGADGAAPLTEGELIERRVLDMHNYVVEPMSYGRLYLAGDAAHLVAPVAAKGMNLALNDALLLTDGLLAHYADGDDSGLAGYSDACLRRVWQYQDFNQWVSEILHGPSSGDPFRAGVAAARLRRMTRSETAGAALAGLYIGSNAEY
ncbi:MAG TPA: 4-hydroxybenzoate 3-monooxygenase [Streptomyces sp.]|nr:4-hydroxybenzoate 3-monooxygenase [Streptomyces sp.]